MATKKKTAEKKSAPTPKKKEMAAQKESINPALASLAKEINEIMDFEDTPIKVKGKTSIMVVDPDTGDNIEKTVSVTDDTIIADIKEVVEDLDLGWEEEEHNLSEEGAKTLAEVVRKKEASVTTAPKAKDKKKEKATAAKKKEANAKKPKNKANTDFSKSNKAQVFLLWNHGKGETDSGKLHKKIKGAVKVNTIKGWLNQWKNNKNLPAIAKQ